MLGKILKYEFKATARIFVLVYAILLVLAAYNAIILPFNGNSFNTTEGSLGQTIISTISSLSIVLYIIVAAAVIVMTIVIIVLRFYRMFGDEGYLWFTLPATANQQLLGKLITAFVWSLASTIMIIISIGLLTIRSGWIGQLYQVSDVWNLLQSLGFNPGLWLVLILVFFFASWLSSIMTFFAAITIGPNIIKSRLGGSVLAYLIITVISQVLGSIGVVVLAVPFGNQIAVLNNVNSLTALTSAAASQAIDQMVILFTVTFIVIYVVFAVALYIISRYFMSRKLNLG